MQSNFKFERAWSDFTGAGWNCRWAGSGIERSDLVPLWAVERGSEHPRERGAEILTAQLRSHALVCTAPVLCVSFENLALRWSSSLCSDGRDSSSFFALALSSFILSFSCSSSFWRAGTLSSSPFILSYSFSSSSLLTHFLSPSSARSCAAFGSPSCCWVYKQGKNLHGTTETL